MKLFKHTSVEPQAKKWWKHFLLGFLFVFLGIWIFITPLASYMSLSLFFTLALVITGFFEIIAAILYRAETKHWGWHVIVGVSDIVIGGFLLFNPVLTMALFPYVLALWFFYKGAVSLLVSLRLRSFDIKGWGWMLTLGIGTLIFASLIILYLGGLSIVFAAGMAFLALGMFHFSVSYHLGKLGKQIKNSS